MPAAFMIGARLLFIVIVMAAAAVAGRAAVVSSLRVTSPDAALQLEPDDAVALGKATDLALIHSGGKIDPRNFAGAARKILRSEPLNAVGLRLLALAADGAQDHRSAQVLMALGLQVSRRDLGTHIWMIEDRVASDDIEGALNYYDLALSISTDAPKLLHPVLSAAIEEPSIRAVFARYLDKGRPWMPGFLNYAIVTSDNPKTIASMFAARGGMPPEPAYRPLETQLLNQLVVKGQYADARRYALTLPAVSPRVLDDPGFTEKTTDPHLLPLTWQLVQTAELRAGREGNEVTMLSEPNSRGVVAARILILGPGSYSLTQEVLPLQEVEPAKLTWEMRCASTDPQLPEPFWRQDVQPAPAGTRVRSSVEIPTECPAQLLTATIAGGDLQGESGVRVRSMVLRPAF